MASRWCFKEHGVRKRYWTWSVLAMDGSAARTSEQRFPDYGAAIHDAIKHRFCPSEDEWVVESTHSNAYFKRGKLVPALPGDTGCPPDLKGADQ